MKKVVLTGSEGSVGRVLTGRSLVDGERPQLDADITRVDVQPDKGDSTHPFIQSDLKDRELIKKLLMDHDILIHGAWNTQEGVLQPDVVDPNNLETARRILECAEELGELATAKVVLLSSVNAHVPQYWKERRATGDLISADEQPQPNRHNKEAQPGNGTTRYGESKIAMEEAGKKAAENGAHVVVPRLGGINLRDRASSTYEVHQNIYEDPERGKCFV